MKKTTANILNESFLEKAIVFLLAIIFIAACAEGYSGGLFFFSSNWQLIGCIWVFLAFFFLCFAVISITHYWSVFQEKIRDANHRLYIPRLVILILFCAITFLFSFLVFSNLNKHFEGFFFRFSVFWIFAITGTILLRISFKDAPFMIIFCTAALSIASGYQIATYLLDISRNPFSLGWSEGSRFYYASLPFSDRLYGLDLPWSFLHPSRYLLLAIPFLFSIGSIFFHRIWQVFLWILMISILSGSVVARIKLKSKILKLIIFLSGFLLFFQAPIYYHLCISAFLVLFYFQVDHVWRNLFIIIISSIWAGISRINWFPLPGILAGLLYVLETPYENDFWSYIRHPLVYGFVGLVASSCAQLAYIPLSGNQRIADFATSFFSDLLWYRLFPNPNYPLGILPGIFLLIFPFMLILLLNYKKWVYPMGRLRLFIICAFLFVFFIGGLFVSVKIGGGSNLHNLDAFILLFFLIVAYVISGKVNVISKSSKGKTSVFPKADNNFLVIMLFIGPVIWSIAAWQKVPSYDWAQINHELSDIEDTTTRVNTNGGDVLFISQRQLLTFDLINKIPLIPEYELLTLMEMSMADYEDYLAKFHQDLQDHRFALIVAYKQYIVFKDEKDVFPEENNSWVKNVSIPILEYYQPITWLRYTDMELYVPRDIHELEYLVTK